jgi:hypothetical protein
MACAPTDDRLACEDRRLEEGGTEYGQAVVELECAHLTSITVLPT